MMSKGGFGREGGQHDKNGNNGTTAHNDTPWDATP
jgi:hypothetical protein